MHNKTALPPAISELRSHQGKTPREKSPPGRTVAWTAQEDARSRKKETTPLRQTLGRRGERFHQDRDTNTELRQKWRRTCVDLNLGQWEERVVPRLTSFEPSPSPENTRSRYATILEQLQPVRESYDGSSSTNHRRSASRLHVVTPAQLKTA